MNRPLMVRCTDQRGEVVYVNLAAGWVWGTTSIEGSQYTQIYNGAVVLAVDANGKQELVPLCQTVRQTPRELKALEREAIKEAMCEEMEIRRELEAEKGDA